MTLCVCGGGGGQHNVSHTLLTFWNTVFSAFRSEKLCVTARLVSYKNFFITHLILQGKLGLVIKNKKVSHMGRGSENSQKVSRIVWMTPLVQNRRTKCKCCLILMKLNFFLSLNFKNFVRGCVSVELFIQHIISFCELNL